MAESIEDLDLTPPQAAQKNAQKVLDWRDKHGEDVKGMTRTGWVRANQLSKGEELSPDIVKRMAQFNRHRKNSGVSEDYEGEPWKDAGHVAWLGWGGDEGVDWAIRMSERIESLENAGKDVVTTLSHKYETVENQGLATRIKSKGVQNVESKPLDKTTYNGYFNALEFDDQNWSDAVDRLPEVLGMLRSFETSIVRHAETGHGNEENVPVFEDPIDTESLNEFVRRVKENSEDETFVSLVEAVGDMDRQLREVLFETVVHDDNMHDRSDRDITEFLSEELEKGEDYESIEGCMRYHVSEKDMDTDQAFATCASEFDVDEEDMDNNKIERIKDASRPKEDEDEAITEPRELEDSETLQKGIIPTHEALGEFGTTESEDWGRPNYGEFAKAYDLEENFADLGKDDKRLVAAHFARVDATDYSDANYSDLQLPHHDPETGDVDRAGVIAARQRLPQSEMNQDALNAIDTHLTAHLRDDFEEENVDPIFESDENSEHVYREAMAALEKADEMGLEGLHTVEVNGDTYFMPGVTHDEYEEAIEDDDEKRDGLNEDQLVSYDTDYGKGFGVIKEVMEETVLVEVHTPQLGGGWSANGDEKELKRDEVEMEDRYPDSMDTVLNSGTSSVGTESVDKPEEVEDEDSEEELSDSSSDGEVTEELNPKDFHQVKKKSDK